MESGAKPGQKHLKVFCPYFKTDALYRKELVTRMRHLLRRCLRDL